ncbi:hypothetical protein HNR46_003045 [Haloferula luteola]|uniref:Uncharacterized protein n=1 Tax=Haloferula luteola TaxID=595692 RepID=A0A840V3C2_9BACT|nr:hypothetical protein [Haloferula luteola]MBB5352797.1 hypothetical protein [Haloferula luteola]
MKSDSSAESSASPRRSILALAKRLHREALHGPPAAALPVLRRLLQSGVIRHLSLPEFFHQRTLVRRKHLLEMLALEAGHSHWTDYRKVLECHHTAGDDHFDLLAPGMSSLNSWFATFEEAQAFAQWHGGRCARHGRQGVVFPST